MGAEKRAHPLSTVGKSTITHPNNCRMSNKLSRKWCQAKEVRNTQAAKINKTLLKQRTMTKVNEQLDHHHVRRASSREVHMKRLVHLQEQARGREQCQVHNNSNNDKLLLSLGRARRACDNEREVIEQKDMGITHASDSATVQQVREPLRGISGNSVGARREDSPANEALISTTPHISQKQTHQEVRYHRANAQYVASVRTKQGQEALVEGLLQD